MLHDWKTFGEEISTLLKTSGDSGDSGDSSKNRCLSGRLAVPTRVQDVSPLENEWGQPRAASGDNNLQEFQFVTERVPTVSTVPTNFAGGVKHLAEAARESRLAHSNSHHLPVELPADWSNGYAAFCAMSPLDDFPRHRWDQAIRDGEAFLSVWGLEAVRLGWRAVDLFGASPAAPWARIGMLGLVLLLNGDPVVALDADAATITTRSGGALRFRRHIAREGGVCLWEIGGAA